MYTYYLIQKLIQNPILNCQKINYTLTLTLILKTLKRITNNMKNKLKIIYIKVKTYCSYVLTYFSV